MDEGLQKIFVPETIDVVFEENNGKLVLVSGPLNIEDDLEDPLYGIKIKAVKLTLPPETFRRILLIKQKYLEKLF